MNTSLNFSNGKENKITKRYYCDNSSEIIPEDYESTDQIYAINDNKLYEIEVSNEKTASGSIASFPDGADNVPVKALSAALEPVQDLHGQSSPYPSGGGKNKLPLTVDGIKALNPNTRGTWNGNKYEYNGITYEIVTDSDGNVAKIHVSGTRTGSTYFNLARIDSVPYGTYILNGGVSGASVRAYHFDGTNSVTSIGPDVTFTSTEDTGNNTFDIFPYSDSALNVDIYPMIRLSTVTDSTYAPYSNICPITGHTQCEVWRSGVNVWDEEWVNGFINDNGVFTARNDIVGTKNAISVKPNTTYRFVRPNVQAFVTFWKKAEAYNELVSTDFISRSSLAGGVATFTTPDNCYAVHFNMVAAYGSNYNSDISVNYPSTNTAYIAHEPIVHLTIPLGQTVYGATIDVVGGVCTVDRAIVDMGTLTWYKNSNTGRFYAPLSPAPPVYSASVVANAKCSTYPIVSWNTISDKKASVFYANVNGINVEDSTYTNAATFKTAMSGQQLVYELATPITIDLSDIPELTTLYGQNNVWSDSGDVSVTYKSSIQQHIAKVISNAIS